MPDGAENARRETDMSKPEEYDVVILGSGAPGKLLGWTLASQGRRSAVVERRYVGGSCPNIACLPSKNVIHGAKVADYFRRGAEFGIAGGDWKVDMAAVRDRKRRMVDGLVEMHLAKYRESGAELVMGQGRFVAPLTIEVALNAGGTRTLRGQTVIIDTGSRARMDDTTGLAEARPLTHVEALELGQLPEHLLVLGGGCVGLELAQAFRRFGSRVTVVERSGALIHREDPDVTEAIERLFRDEGIDVLTGTSVDRVEGRSGESVRLHTGRGAIEGTHLLLAGGRTPNTDGIGLEKAGVETDEKGHVKVDARLRTTAEGVWAVGDCAGSPYFTHIGEDDFRVVLSEQEARDRGVRYRLAKIPMSSVFRAQTISETRGFLKALIEEHGDRILGFTALGVEAGEVMAVVQVAMLAGLPYTALRDAVLTHPTIAEGLAGLFSSVPRG
jgi:pyruvate/2-oxoglutarate dehydrogenase complex dihydrolipoamide dehydrogenase (E3) component